jgi:hypothetical protein
MSEVPEPRPSARLGATGRRVLAALIAGLASTLVAAPAVAFALGGMFLGPPGVIITAVLAIITLAVAIGLPHRILDEEARAIAIGVVGAVAVLLAIGIGFFTLVTSQGSDPWWLPLGFGAPAIAAFLVAAGVSLAAASQVALRISGAVLLLAAVAGVGCGFPPSQVI